MSRRKKLSSAGWHALAPGRHERTIMQKDCGSKCFLGPVGESCFPICTKNTCDVNDKGVYAAYVRAREYGSKNMHMRSRHMRSRHMRSRHMRSRHNKTKKKKHAIYGHNHSKTLYRKIAGKAKTLLKKLGYAANLK
jgi:hypothetical protein